MRWGSQIQAIHNQPKTIKQRNHEIGFCVVPFEFVFLLSLQNNFVYFVLKEWQGNSFKKDDREIRSNEYEIMIIMIPFALVAEKKVTSSSWLWTNCYLFCLLSITSRDIHRTMFM